MADSRPVGERALEQILFGGPHECWRWPGMINQAGYGIIRSRSGGTRKEYRAHRVVYEEMVGPIPAGLVIDHLCRTRACVNPAHMEPVTSEENVRRGRGYSHEKLANRTHCKHGHPWEGDNVYVNPRGYETCRSCARRRTAEWKQRQLTSQGLGVDNRPPVCHDPTKHEPDTDGETMPAKPTTRERVRQLASRGLTVREIASVLGVSTQAVYKHLRKIEAEADEQGAA